jgi:phosphoribosylformylglycinamidine cyclo-ligase
MGAGFAVFCRPGYADAVVAAAMRVGQTALISGRVEEGPRRVVAEPLGVEYSDEELRLG